MFVSPYRVIEKDFFVGDRVQFAINEYGDAESLLIYG